MSSLLNIAKEYRDAGLSVVASDRRGTNLEWLQFQERLPTDDELTKMFTDRYPNICIICGKGSGNLEVIDVDTKNDTSGTIWERLLEALLDYYKGELPFAMVKTPSGGMHLYYRCEVIDRSQHLSENIFKGVTKANIETRGHKGLVMAPPTKNYQDLDNRLPYNIPTISVDERDDLLSICRSFNEVEKVVRQKSNRPAPKMYKHNPWDAYNADENDPWRDVLLSEGWVMTTQNELREKWRKPNKSQSGHSATWNKELRKFYVFTPNAKFELSPPAHSPYDIYCTLKCDGNKAKATAEIKKLGYGAKFNETEEKYISNIVELFAQGNQYEAIMEMSKFDWDKDFEDVKDITQGDLVAAAESRYKAKSGEFWYVDGKGKYHLDKARLGDFLRDQGYRLLVDTVHAESYRLVKIDYSNHLIEQMYPDLIRKDIEAWIIAADDKSAPIGAIRNLIRSVTDATMKVAIEHLPRVPLNSITFLRDTSNPELTSWFAFSNGVVKITKEHADMVKYHELPDGSLIWKQYIIDFPIELSSDLSEADLNNSTIWLFLKRIAGITKDIQHLEPRELAKDHKVLQNRFNAIITTLGYFLCNFKNKAEPIFPVIGEDVPDDRLGGGTGKGIFVEIISKLRNVVIIDSKIWSPTDRFPFQLVKLGTDIVIFDDMPKNFAFEKLFSVITTGMTIENKNEKSFYIPYEHSPKLGGTSNFDTDDSSDAAARRQRKIYFSRYFNKDYQPSQEFGILFGPQWTEYDYQLFYNILFGCLRMYIKYGIIPFPETDNAKNKSLVGDMGLDFKSFMDDFVPSNLGKWKHKKEFTQEILSEMQDADKKFFTSGRFERNLTKYAKKMGYEFHEKKNKSRSAGVRDNKYVIFVLAGQPMPEMTAQTILEEQSGPKFF